MGKIINNGIVYGGGSSVELDATLSIEGKAADAQAVGKALGIEISLADYEALSDEEKNSGTYWINDSNEPLGDGSRFLKTTDVVDSLDIADPAAPLSANMGRKLSDKLTWKLIGSVVGIGNPIHLPTETYSEFLIITGTPVYKWSRHYTKNELNTFSAFVDSYYDPTMIINNSPSAQIVRGDIRNSNEISLAEVWQNGVKNNESGTLVVYGR